MSPLPPYALAPVVFPLRSLAALAGRAALGGEREAVLGCFVAARLAIGAVGSLPRLPVEARVVRAAAARAWLASLALPAVLRVPLARLVDASATEPPVVLPALIAATVATAPWLDAAAVAELEELARTLSAARAPA